LAAIRGFDAMIARDSLEQGVPALKLEAIDWATRISFGGIDEAERGAFETWRALSPAHEAAFGAALAFVRQLGSMPLDAAALADGADEVVSIDRARTPRLGRRAFLGGGAIAASVAAGVIAARSPLSLWPSLSEWLADERTPAGARRTLTPMAGVRVEMNSRTSLSRIAQGVRLVSGQVFVAAAGAARFTVEAGEAAATASAARFDVRNYDGNPFVSCIAGAVTASIRGSSALLHPGEALGVRNGTVIHTQVDANVATAWRRGLLIFDQTPLAAAVAEINQYYDGRLVLRSSAGGRPVTGIFHIDQIETAVVQIQALQGMSATRLPGGVVLLG
jgi:transmembrane sensor